MKITNPSLKSNEIKYHQVISVWPSQLIITLLFFSFIIIPVSASAQALTTSLERSSITFGESATLVIDISGSASKDFQPDLSPLKKDFDIVNTGRNTQIQIINGRRTDKIQLSITLMPHHYGQYTIPSIKVGSDQTRPLQLTVKDIPVVSSSKEGQSVWLEIETPLNTNNTDVMVQQGIPVTVKLFTALSLSNINISQPAAENAISEKVGDNIRYTVQQKGQNYHVVEQHYVIYPEQPGDLIIPPVVMRATTPDANQQRQRRPFGGNLFDDPFFTSAFGGHSQIQQMLKGSSMFSGNQGKSVSVRSDGLKLFIKHIPDEAKGTAWLPAQKVTLSSSWDNNPPNLKSGEPSTLTLTIKAEGLTSANIPALHIADKKGSYRVYEEPVEMENLTDGQRVIGISRQKFTLIPEQAGLLKFPAIRQAWWNTKTNQMQVAEIPAIDLPVIQGADFSNINSTSLSDNRQLPDEQHSSDAMA
ncbi:MAG: BatD family protein, partial [Gammaproteobacteria bacterium]|nr:BatD family protein [Gammaproteobacteria bacterium]